MTRDSLPNWREKQKILYLKGKNAPLESLSSLGDHAFSLGYLQDAFEYYKMADNHHGLERLKQIAIDEGDTFLLSAIEKVGLKIETEVWNKIGYRAFETGKYCFAKKAFERTQNELMLAKLHATLENNNKNASPSP